MLGKILLLDGCLRQPQVLEYLRESRKSRNHCDQAELFGQEETGQDRRRSDLQCERYNLPSQYICPATDGLALYISSEAGVVKQLVVSV